jgi:uncharacterized membrane protein
MEKMAAQLVDDGTESAVTSATSRAARRRALFSIAAVTAGALAFYLYHAFADQDRFLTTGYDLGIFDQAVRAYSHFQAPIVPLKGAGYNIFGDHFHPIIALLAPLYWIWNNVGVLLIAQAVLTAASVPVVYRFARRRAGEWMSLLIAAVYAFGWPLQGLIDFDFHEVAFATPLLALAIDALDRRDDRQLAIWCALLLLVREDMGVLVALLGVLLLAQRRGRRRFAFAMIGVGVFTYWLTTSLIIPHFAHGHQFAYGNQFGQLGSSVGAAAVNVLTHPWHAADVFFTPGVKSATLAALLLPWALLPLRSRYTLLAVPLLAERFFNSRHNLWTTTFHYNALPWLVFCLGMVDAAGRLGVFEADRRAALWRRSVAAIMAGTPVLFIVLGNRTSVVPVTELRRGYANMPDGWAQSARDVLNYLPRNVCVVADNHLVPHLTGRDYTSVAQAEIVDPDFYALDMFAPDTGGNPPAPKPEVVWDAAIANGYHLVFRSGTWVVLQAPDYTGPSSVCKPLGHGKG